MIRKTFIDSHELNQHLDDPDWVIVDCRFDLDDLTLGQKQYEDSHIPGAQYAHLETDLSAEIDGRNGRHPLPKVEAMVEVFSRLGIDSSCQVVAYDDKGGGFAARLWWMLRYLGHSQVAVLNGGFPAWVDSGFHTHRGSEKRGPRQFVPQPSSVRLISKGQILAKQAGFLIDSRSPERYMGQVEPRDPIAGRIPGARNRFWQDNLDPNSQIRSVEDIRKEFQDILQGMEPEKVTLYCGSGVTGCLNLLAMEYAGLEGAALYTGSWSEWVSDPSAPVATGPSED
jgi:thiosulfate/3-mercaptopyruvate sulfurtransferase